MFKKILFYLLALLLLTSSWAFAEYNQAPEFEEQVQEGNLPEIEDRLPENPKTIEVDSTGDYGGTLNSISTRAISWGEDNMLMDPANLVVAEADGGGVETELAEKIESNEDKSVWTFHLREGVKWSDGEPFTAEDILFWYERVILNEDLTPVVGPAWKAEGEVVEVSVIDDYTVEFSYAGPKPYLPYRLVHETIYYPKHYAKNFHPDYVEEEKLEEMMDEEDFDNWWELFNDKAGIWSASLLGTIPVTNPDLPTLAPYVLVDQSSDRRIYERNPYYWKVDDAGNQLPYIERIDTNIVNDREVVNGKIMSGEVDFAGFETDIRNYPMFRNYEDEGGYRTLTWTSGMGSDVIYMVNQTSEDENLREIFQEKEFRQALSLAIDRDEINESIYFGRGEPRQYTVIEGSRYFEEEFAKSNIEFDPERAEELLDEIGLKDQNGDGVRELPNGEEFTFTVEFYPSETPKAPNVELVIEHWKDIGIDVNSKQVSGELQEQRA
ncbi:MAG: ABC transporter substrate-binding protein, partial [Halanaerobiales bacterium]